MRWLTVMIFFAGLIVPHAAAVLTLRWRDL